MTVNGGTPTHYILNGQSVAQEWVDTDFDGVIDQNETVTYLNGPRGPEYRLDTIADPDAIRWYLYDGLGSVVGEVDASGNVTSTTKYDVYGSIRGSTGSSDSQHKFVGKLGHTTDPDTGGLIYMRARWMDPITGRFISEDPKYDGDNWYAYCYNDPINGTDPTGEFVEAAYDAEVVAVAGFGLAGVLLIIAGYNADLTLAVGSIDISFSKQQADNADFNRVAGEMGLTKPERDELHREISKRGIGLEELWDRARDLVARRDPCGRRDGKPKRK